MGQLASDDFAGTGALSANWTTVGGFGAPARVSDQISKSSSPGGAYYNGVSWPNDQWSQIKLVGNSRVDVGVRIANVAGERNSYLFQVSGTGSATRTISKYTNNVGYETVATGTVSTASGDTLYLEIQGDALSAKVNGVEVLAGNDASFSSGNAGIDRIGVLLDPDTADDWAGGDFAAVYEQAHFRWRADDGDEDGASWVAAEDVNIATAPAIKRRLRIQTRSSEVDPPDQSWSIRFRRKGSNDIWIQPSASTPYIRLAASAFIAASSADPTTAQLTSTGAGTFAAGTIQDDTSGSGFTNLVLDGYTEHEWSLIAVEGEAQPGHCFEFRVEPGGSPAGVITVTPEWGIQGGHTPKFSEFPKEKMRAAC
jgi:hypothetical protein